MTSPAVLFLIFNRPDKTRTVFESIRKARPARLFIAADGPRPDESGEAYLCEKTRQTVLDLIDWPCEVKTLFREKNLGCKIAVSSAITWFFEQVEEGIILEDDCLPDPTFFSFCEVLLETNREDPSIMMISGFNLHPELKSEHSYFFSRYGCIWGWATWKRAWQHYDLEMKNWPEYKESGIMTSFLSNRSLRKRTALFDSCLSGNISTWDLQWTFSRWHKEGLSIVPQTNLIRNIGTTGVHMKPYDPGLTTPVKPVTFPLIHPKNRMIDKKADHLLEKNINRGVLETTRLILRYLWDCFRQRKNIPHEVQDVALCLCAEIKARHGTR